MRHFAIVEKLCRAALIHSGNAPEVHRQVAHLKNALIANKEGAVVEAEDGGQVAALERLLGRFSSEPAAPALGVAPTPETRARLRQDTVRHMLGKGTLEREHAEAAEEIRDVFEAVTTGLWPAARRLDLGGAMLGAGRRAFRQPLERLPKRLGALWQRRYKPWADAMGAVQVTPSNIVSYSAFQLAIAVLVDGRSLAEIDRGLGVRRGTAAAYLRGALHRYAVMAGWLRPRLSVGAGTDAGEGEASEGSDESGDGPEKGRMGNYPASCGCGASFTHRGAEDAIACPRCGERRDFAAAAEEAG